VREVRVTGKQDAFINKTIRKIKIRDIDWFTVTWQSTVKLWQNKNSDAAARRIQKFFRNNTTNQSPGRA
jgi:hypothetical protein